MKKTYRCQIIGYDLQIPESLFLLFFNNFIKSHNFSILKSYFSYQYYLYFIEDTESHKITTFHRISYSCRIDSLLIINHTRILVSLKLFHNIKNIKICNNFHKNV